MDFKQIEAFVNVAEPSELIAHTFVSKPPAIEPSAFKTIFPAFKASDSIVQPAILPLVKIAEPSLFICQYL